MSAKETVIVPGKSGTQYTYWVLPLRADMKSVAGNYLFARKLPSGNYEILYAGETADLSGRFDNHHKWDAVCRKGATNILAHTSEAGQVARRNEEADIRAKFDPPCNG